MLLPRLPFMSIPAPLTSLRYRFRSIESDSRSPILRLILFIVL